MVSKLEHVLVRTPTIVGNFVADAQWREPDRDSLVSEHSQFVTLLEKLGCTVHIAPAVDGLVDAVYMHDPMIMTPHGAILLQMGKRVRQPEPAQIRQDLERLGVPILGELSGSAIADGGDKVWLDAKTLLIGYGYRTNGEGIAQIRTMLSPFGVEVHAFDLPHFQGPDAVLHLMSVLSPISHTRAVVYEPLAPIRLLEFLKLRNITWLTVNDKEVHTQGANILTVAPNVVILAAGNPEIEAKLRKSDVAVHIFDGANVAVKGDGGPTCLTAPLSRVI